MKLRAIHIYVILVLALAVVVLPAQDWVALLSLSTRDIIGLAFLICLGLLAESLALTINVGRNAGNSSVAFLPLLTSVLLFGPAAGVTFLVLVGGIAEFGVRKKEAIRASFNVAQYTLSATIGGWGFIFAGGAPLVMLDSGGVQPSVMSQLIPFATFCLLFFAINLSAVSLAIALSQGLPFRKVWTLWAGRSGSNIFYDLLICPFALFVAFVYLELWVAGIILTMLPLLFIRYSYLTTHKLQQANRDLLKVLIKAIETRDPYTSGHSLRVSALAQKIASRLSLPERVVESVTTAALLHDIGKIDIIYEEILQKSDSLSTEERDVIESHVTKGVDLLTSLSSFDPAVIEAVKHHHELYDGSGYPSGLLGVEIPIGARIIKVCDAIDAMLSDRPYRRALLLPEVRLQLESNAGTQFDPQIIVEVLRGSLLPEHAAEVEREASRTSGLTSATVPRNAFSNTGSSPTR